MLNWQILFRFSQMPPALTQDRLRDRDKTGRLNAAPAHERHFYSATRAFGRFGMRIFEPQLMPAPHWHGHIEANFAIDHQMDYEVDGDLQHLPAA
jgi:hypothetical protein